MAEPRPAVPGRIFISYRREETAYPAGWLFDRLADHYGGGQVFKDVDSIELGDDFVEVITTAVASCDVLLALIGDQWLTITDEDGRRRLDNPDDFVRLEIEAALARKVRVIPILVDGARMPRPDQLPPSLAPLARRQALELSPSRFEFDTTRLVRVLDKTLAEARRDDDAAPVPAARAPDARAEPPAARGWRGRITGRTRALIALGVAAVLGSLLIAGISAISDNGAAVFEDDFSSRAAGWDEAAAESNGGHYANGAYRLYADQERNEGTEGSWPRNERSVYPSAPVNIQIEVDARKVAGKRGGYGILCRDDSKGDNGYLFQIWDNDVAIEKYFDSKPWYKTLKEKIDSRAVKLTGTNKMQAACTNDEAQETVHLTFWVNDQKVAEYTDPDDPFVTGTVGLFVTTDKAIEAEFDNFVVNRY
jgi:TIR domain